MIVMMMIDMQVTKCKEGTSKQFMRRRRWRRTWMNNVIKLEPADPSG